MNREITNIDFKENYQDIIKQNKRNQFFWAQLSKEIRTSLSGISGITADIKENLYKTEDLERKIDEIKYNADVLFDVANNIVDYSFLSQNKFELKPVVFDIKDFMTELMIELNGAASRRKIQLLTNVHDIGKVQLSEDRNRLKQIIKGYSEYAINHTNYGGNIYITLGCMSRGDGRLQVSFNIKTSGSTFYQAISGEYEYMKTEMFHKNKFEGSGIELYVCNCITDMMHGRVEFSSGSEFESQMNLTFSFDGTMEESAGYMRETMFEKERILIFDEDENWCRENTVYFEDIGVRYDVALNSDEALEMIGEAEETDDMYDICLFRNSEKSEETDDFAEELRSIFGDELILIEVFEKGVTGIERNSISGIDYVVDSSWIRSTIFDTLMKLKRDDLVKKKEMLLQEHKFNFENRRVLLAEDVAMNAELVTKLLNHVNVSVTVAVNGLEAVSLFNRKPEGYFNCVLMDINMPVMDGYKATMEIRNSKKDYAKSIPIYAMTANAMAGDIQAAIDSGMDGHISKPVNPDKLYEILNKIFATIEDDHFVNLQKKAEELSQKNDELLTKAEHDHLTGLLNRHGYERKIKEYSQLDEPVGLMLIDLDKFKGINDNYGHQVGDQVLQKLALTLSRNFRSTDDVIRFGGDEFAVILNQILDERDFVIKIVKRINEELMNPEDGLPQFSISTGVAFSESGYTDELYNQADQALYIVKEQGRCGCRIFSEEEASEIDQAKPEIRNIDNAVLEKVLNENTDLLVEKDSLINMALENNSAVGVICGYYDQQLPVYSISRSTLKRLGYTYEEFLATTGGKFEPLVYLYDVSSIYDTAAENRLLERKIRLLHKNGNTIWFNIVVTNTRTSAGEKMWFASFREIDGSLLGEMCRGNYAVVAVMNADNGRITFEKGLENLPGYQLERGMKYDYDTLLRFSIDRNIPENSREEVYQQACLENVMDRLSGSSFYEFTAEHIGENIGRIRYQFRYINSLHDLILCTQEYEG